MLFSTALFRFLRNDGRGGSAAKILCIVFLFIPMGAYAQDGWFIGLGAARVDIGGDMDGQTYVTDGSSISVLPKQDPATGYEILIGHRSESYSLAFGVTGSKHNGQWLGAISTTDFNSYNIDFKYYLRPAKKIQPLFLIGVGFTSVTVRDGSSNGIVVQDATFRGIDARFGGGAEFVVYRHLSFDLQAVYRYGSYNTVDGVSTADIKDSVNGDGLTASAIAKLTF